uniref:CdaR family protein n=1 Tax=uncultured Draconibacterium sp. TaxID=1573823 RepID=UPI003217D247
MNKKIEKIPGFSKVEQLKNNKQAVVFLVCLLIATVLWFLNALSKDYSTTISYPVKYVNPPSHQFLSNELPSKLDLKVDAHGFTLLRHKLSLAFSPIILNLNSITRGVLPQDGTYEVKTNQHLKRIASQVSNEINVREVQPEILYIVLDSLKSKSVPVKYNVQLDFKPQFNLQNPVSSEPKEVKITGPSAIVDTIQFLTTEKKSFKQLDVTTERNLKIMHPDKTTVVPEKVLLKINVEKFTEKEIKVPVKILNKPENVNIKLFPSEVKVNCLVGLSEFENIHPDNFEVVVDYESIGDGSSNLAVIIISKPVFIQLTRFAPETVEYLIETN